MGGCRWLLALVFVLAGPVLAAAPPPSEAEREIAALIDGLRDSPCRFERNGRWYDGEKAAAHLRRKYDYAREHGKAGSAEDFIELAASRSSFTGRPYRVQCGEQAAMESGAWFLARLALLRGPKPGT